MGGIPPFPGWENFNELTPSFFKQTSKLVQFMHRIKKI